MKVYPLKDGNFSVDRNKTFTELGASVEGKNIKIAVRPFLVRVSDKYVLLDAGLGREENGVPIIIGNLLCAGVQQENISKVLLSHLHKDHVNGLVDKRGSKWRLNFPNATVYIQAREYEFALSKNGNPSFDSDVLDFISHNADISWMREDNGRVSPEISFKVTGGHTPYHQVFYIREEGQTVFYGADNLPTAAYLEHQIAFKTDFDGKKAMEERRRWQEEGQNGHWEILLYHDMENAILQL